MNKDRGRMQDAIEEWRERAESDIGRDAIQSGTQTEDLQKSAASGEIGAQALKDSGEEAPAGAVEQGVRRRSASRSFKVTIPDEAPAAPEPDAPAPGQTAAGRADDAAAYREAVAAAVDAAEEADSLESGGPIVGPQDNNEVRRNTDAQPPEQDLLREMHKTQWVETICGGIITALLVLLGLAPVLHWEIPYIVSWSEKPLFFIGANMILLVLLGAVCFSTLAAGLKSLFRYRSGSASLVFVSYLGAMAGNAALFAQPGLVSQRKIFVFSGVAALCLFADSLARLLNTARARKNHQWMERKDVFKTCVRLNEAEKESGLTAGLNDRDASVVTVKKALCLTDYMRNAFADTNYDKAAKILAPCLLAASFAAAVLAFLFSKNAVQSAAVFAIVCCTGVPLTGALNPALPLWRACRRLRRKDALLTGWQAVDSFSDTDAAVLDARQIFPEGSVRLCGIKSFKKQKIDNDIVDAASLVCAAGGTLAYVFMQVIGGKTEFLRSVQSYEYEDGKGLIGWVENRRVLIGSRELMIRHGIPMPSRSIEAKYISKGWDIVYLAVSGELSALVIIDYEASVPVALALKKLQKLKVSLLISALDPCITKEMLADSFNLNKKRIKILTSKESETAKRRNSDCREPASLAFAGGAEGYAGALNACIKLKGTGSVLNVLQIAGELLGVFFMLFIAVVQGVSAVTPLSLLTYQGIWAVPVLLIALARNHV